MTTTAVTLDKDGKPVVGGRALVIQPRADGILLAVLVQEAGVDTPTYRYLAYPLEKEAQAQLRVLSKPAPGCYWTERRIPVGKDDGNGHIWEMNIYAVKEGPFKGLELRRVGQHLVLVESQRPLQNGSLKDSYIGTLFDYDNLDDGK